MGREGVCIRHGLATLGVLLGSCISPAIYAQSSDTASTTTADSSASSSTSSAPASRGSSGDQTRDAALINRGFIASSEAPRFKLLRYDEDYSYLKDPERRTDPWDSLKYIPLFNRDDWFLSLGGETRQRFEEVRNDDLGKLAYLDGYYLQRYMLHGDLHLSPFFRFFGQFQSGFIDGRRAGPRPDIDRNIFDIHQGFGDFVFPLATEGDTITFRIGRQEMAYGSGRLIDVREGPNLRRSFDGARFLTRWGEGTLDGWWTKPVLNNFYAFDDDPDPRKQFWGLYGAHPLPTLPSGNIDLYYLGLINNEAEYEQGEGREVRHSVGTRIWARPMPWEYNFEYVWQFGTFGSGRINAWTASQALRYNFSDVPLKPRPGLRFDFASGDRNPNSTTLGTFNPLFPSGVYFNLANPIGPSNIIDFHPTFDLFLGETVMVTFDWNFFWRESTGDGVYRLSGSILRGDGGSDARFVGHSPAITATWNPTRHLSILASYVYFRPGDFLRDNPPADPLSFFTTWVTYKF